MKKFSLRDLLHHAFLSEHSTSNSTQESDVWLRKACEGWKGENKKKVEVKGDGNKAGGVRGGK